MTPATCVLALSLFIVAGCASKERAPAAANPAPAAAPGSQEARPVKEIATAESPQAEGRETVVAEIPRVPEPATPPPPAAAPVVTPPVQPAEQARSPSAESRPAPAAKAPAPVAKAPAPATKTAVPATKAPAPAATAPASRAAAAASAGSSSASAQPARTGGDAATAGSGGAQLNLTALEQRLRDTNAIGVMTKITLKNQVDELLERFKAHHEGRDKTPLAQLRQPYDTLIMKVLSLLQDKDPSLASSIVQSREAIWGILTDRNRFSSL